MQKTKLFFIFPLALISTLLFATTPALAVTPTGANSNPDNFLGGIFHGQVTHDVTDNTAFMGAIEAGPDNYRASGTLGWNINPLNRIKFTGEYLTQDIDYTFFSGVTRQWVAQGAAGVDYQRALGGKFENYFNLAAFYSHAPSVGLSTVTGTFTPVGGALSTFVDIRRIAGSNAGGVSPGITTHLWEGSETTLSVNWDDVVYANTLGPQQTAEGFGGKLAITQRFLIRSQTFQVGATAADRAPFNNYTAEVDWIKPNSPSMLTVGLFGGYVEGKVSLPSTSIVGVNVSFAMDALPKPNITTPQGIEPDSFTSWMSEPAVYMPQVLAIADQRDVNKNICTAATPTFAGPIPNQLGRGTITFNSPTHFTGDNLVYTLTHTNTPGSGSRPTITINPGTGVVTWKSNGHSWSTTMTITATNPCGVAVSSNTFQAEASA